MSDCMSTLRHWEIHICIVLVTGNHPSTVHQTIRSPAGAIAADRMCCWHRNVANPHAKRYRGRAFQCSGVLLRSNWQHFGTIHVIK